MRVARGWSAMLAEPQTQNSLPSQLFDGLDQLGQDAQLLERRHLELQL
jgi:hypothetical protein